MKKFYSLLLILVLSLVLVACGSSDDADSADDNSGDGESETPDTVVIGFVPSQDSDTIADTVEPLANTAPELESDFFSNTVSAGGHDTAAVSVLQGDADVATTFDDVRTDLEEEYPDVMDKLRVIEYTQDIPNDTISVTKELDDEFVQKIKETFLSFNDDEEMINIMNGVYNWDAIIEASDEEYKVVKDTYKKFKDNIEL